MKDLKPYLVRQYFLVLLPPMLIVAIFIWISINQGVTTEPMEGAAKFMMYLMTIIIFVGALVLNASIFLSLSKSLRKNPALLGVLWFLGPVVVDGALLKVALFSTEIGEIDASQIVICLGALVNMLCHILIYRKVRTAS